jgi:hypothetical protein
MIHPARWDPPSPSPAAESVHVVAACHYRHRSPQRIGVSRRASPSLADLAGPRRRNPRTRRFRACRGARSGVRWAASRARLGPLGVSGGFGRVRRLLCAGARVSDDIRRYGCPARPWAGHPYLQRESSPVRSGRRSSSERWPLQAGDDPRGVRRTPLHDPVWERGRHNNFSGKAP